MLCSHSKKFIYFKTVKTAGTSVEIFFERFCYPNARHLESHSVQETITPAGIVGSRMEEYKTTDTYYNHMSAREVRAELGAPIFDTYLKFCVVRNPYDKMVSKFWWNLFSTDTDPDKKEGFARLPFDSIRTCFSKYIDSHIGNLCTDRNIYTIDNTLVMDKVIHFENLRNGIDDVCNSLGISSDLSALGTYKGGYRVRPEHYSLYYDSDSIAAIQREFSFELEVFGYSL